MKKMKKSWLLLTMLLGLFAASAALPRAAQAICDDPDEWWCGYDLFPTCDQYYYNTANGFDTGENCTDGSGYYASMIYDSSQPDGLGIQELDCWGVQQLSCDYVSLGIGNH